MTVAPPPVEVGTFAAECAANVARVRERFTWEAALEPLLRFCRAPRHAPDRPSAKDARDRSGALGVGGVLAPRLAVVPPPTSLTMNTWPSSRSASRPVSTASPRAPRSAQSSSNTSAVRRAGQRGRTASSIWR